MRDELYIDGTKVDMGDSGISLEYRSNIFTDVSKIVSNFSYTIRLPKTKNNLRLIECAHIPSAVSTFPYISHTAILLRDGVQIIDKANVVLISVSETIEIALSWGNINNFEVMVNNGKTLKEMSYGMNPGVDYTRWGYMGSSTPQFLRINYGLKDTERSAWYHPVVTAKWIIDKISQEYGITIEYPEDRMDMLDRLKIPLLKKDIPQDWMDKYTTELTANGMIKYDLPAYQFDLFTFSLSGSTYYSRVIYQLVSESDNVIAIQGTKDVPVKMEGKIIITVNTDMNPINAEYPVELSLRNKDNMASKIVYQCRAEIESLDTNQYRYTFNIDTELKIDTAEDVSFVLYDPYSQLSNRSLEEGSIKIRMRDTVHLYTETNDDPSSSFFYVPNLPDIKQIDFLKATSSMLGLFAMPTQDNHLKFVSYDTLLGSKSVAVDWSSKLVRPYIDYTPRKIIYSLDDFAKNNWFRWKEDDDVKGNYDGKIVVDSEYLDYEKEMVELPFAACDSVADVASIPLYSYDAEGNLVYNDNLEPRIVLVKRDFVGTFDDLSWDKLLGEYYFKYKQMIKTPKIITEYVKLNPVELKSLDMAVPIYLKQYGCFWAVIKVKTMDNNICEVELLKI